MRGPDLVFQASGREGQEGTEGALFPGLGEVAATAIFGSKVTPRDAEAGGALPLQLCVAKHLSRPEESRDYNSVLTPTPLVSWEQHSGLLPRLRGPWRDLSGARRPVSCKWRREPGKVWLHLFVSLGWRSQLGETWRRSRYES